MAQRLVLAADPANYQDCDACKTGVAAFKVATKDLTEEAWALITNTAICDILTDATQKENCLKGVNMYKQIKSGASDEAVCQEAFDLCKTNYVAIGAGVVGVGVLGGGGYFAYTKYFAQGAGGATV